MSSAPNFSSAAATIFFGASSPVMSAAHGAIASLPACAVSIADSGRSTASTCAPSSANSLAEAAPMPDAAPVTMAILPLSLPIAFLLHSTFTPEASATRCHRARSFSITSANTARHARPGRRRA